MAKQKFSKIYILLEGDYYDTENRPVAATSKKEVADAWKAGSPLNSVEEVELDNLSSVAYGFRDQKIPNF